MSDKAKILVIDDEEDLRRLLVTYLTPRGYEILTASCAKEGIRMAYEECPSLVILDIIMPEIDGWQTCQCLREMSDIPIIILTAKVTEQDAVHSFQLGADDYVRKPFSVRELEMRVQALLDRAATEDCEIGILYEDDWLKINLAQRQVFRRGPAVHLTPTEFHLLVYLVRHQGRVVPFAELFNTVWESDYIGDKGCLYVYIRYLREKLEPNPREPRYIRTRRGVGYQFVPADAVEGE